MRQLLPLVLCLLAAPLSAAPLDEFESRVRSELIKPFARDLGGLLGSTGFHNGRALGFPGFEAGVLAPVQTKPDADNRILRDAGVDAFGLPLLHAAVGLPANFDLVAHGLKVQNAAVYGGGVRYGIVKSGMLTKFMPDIGVSAFADRVNHPDFFANHFAANLGVGWDLPIVQPFAGLGVDWTKLEVRVASLPNISGQSAHVSDWRAAVGADITPFPFLRLRLAGMMLHGVPGGQLGLLFKF